MVHSNNKRLIQSVSNESFIVMVSYSINIKFFSGFVNVLPYNSTI